MFKKILVTLDGSSLAEKVLPYVTALATEFGAEVVLLHVLKMPAISTSPEANIIEDKEIATKEAQEYLERIKKPLADKGLDVRPVIVEGQPASVIVDYAELEKVDLIAMSTHGRSGIDRWMLGSVAERVLRAANCPVLLIRVHQGD